MNIWTFGNMKFRVLTRRNEGAVKYMADLLKKEGFKIYDLREADLVSNITNEKVFKSYVLCCEGRKRDFERFKQKHDILDEISYEGYRTLM